MFLQTQKDIRVTFYEKNEETFIYYINILYSTSSRYLWYGDVPFYRN